VRPHRLIPGSRFRAALASELEPLAGALATLARLSFAAPLSHLRSLLRLLAGGAGDDEPLASFARHPGIAQLAGLRWAAAARVGLLSLLLRSLPREADWAPPAGTSPTELRDALAEALGGEPIAPQAPPLPLAALAQAADALDERLFTLLELVGPEAVAADPGLPLRLLPQVAKLPALRAPQRRLMGLRLRLDQGGPSQGSGLGAERTGIDLRGDLRALLPSQLALPDSVLRARHLRGDLLYRARDGREPPRLKPTVLLLDVSPPTFGPVETVTRLAAHAVASSLLEAGLPVVLITVGGEGSFHPLERREDLVEIWTRRSLEEAQEARALTAARAMAETLREGALEPIVLVLSHAFFGAEAAPSPAPGLRGLFVGYPGGAARPALAEACERWEVLVAGEVESLHDRLGGLVG
jgi:ATP-dependent Clp protease ATP-binding subunit ClpC